MTKQVKKTNAKAPAKAKRAPKQSNQTAKLAANDDIIATVVISKDGNYIVASSHGGATLARPRNGDSKEFRSYATVGGKFSALKKWDAANPAPKPQAKLARGIEARQAPHSAKAVADQKKPEAKAAPAKRAAKAEKNKQPSKGAERTYKLGSKKNEAKPDTWRHHMLSMIQKATSTEAAKKLHAKSGKFSANKLDFNWANAQGYIKFDK